MVSKKSLSLVVILALFFIASALPFASAIGWDNTKDSITVPRGESLSLGGEVVEYNPIWEKYKPIKVTNAFGFGKTLMRGAITQHDDFCGADCSSTFKIYLAEDSVLIDDVDFYTIKDDGLRVKQDVRSYQFYIIKNKKLIPYELGTQVSKGNYEVQLYAEKKPSRTVDWVIKTQGETLTSWAVWGENTLTNDLVSYWKLDEASGTIDDSGGSNDGTVSGATYSQPGIINTSMGFDGNDKIEFGTSSSLRPTAEITYSSWFKTSSTGSGKYLINNEHQTGDRGGGLRIETTNKCGLRMHIGASLKSIIGTTTVTDNTWHHCAATYNGSTITLYVDGSPEGTPISATGLLSYNSVETTLGKRSEGASPFYFIGDIDETGIWNRSLTSTEISDIWNVGIGISYPFNNGIVTLNSPADNFTSTTPDITFNCSATITGGATLTNMSLWDNSTGSWAIRNTSDLSFSSVEGLVSYYELDEQDTSGTGTIIDSTGLHDGTNVGADNSTGKIGTAYDFVASNSDRIDLGFKFLTRPITVNLWAKSEDAGTTDFYFGADDGGFDWTIYEAGGTWWISTGTDALSSGQSVTTDWVMLTMVINTTNSYIYTNGTLRATGNTADQSTVNDFHIGDVTGSRYPDALIDEVGIWNKSLSPSEISDLWNTGLAERPGSPTSSTQTFQKTISGPTDWTCSAGDSDGDRGFGENRTVSLDSEAPAINITFPTTSFDYRASGQNTSLNWTVNDTGTLASCWYEYNNTNSTVPCASQNASFILTSQKNITFYANDSVANEGNFTRSWTYKVFGNSETYNLTTYETAAEGFKINLTSDGTQLVLAALVYDGTAYTTTKVGNNSEMEFNRNIILPQISTPTAQNKSFYWNITYGSEVFPSATINQSVGRIALGLCNSTLTVPYINLTFKDEETTIATNATIDTSTWNYYLASGDGTVNNTLLYLTTNANESYGFCFIPSDRTLTSAVELQYSDTGYPQRRWSTSGSLTNTTSTPTLYMLASADGTYSVYQVQDTVGNGIEGVAVVVERQFVGVWTLVEQGTTDSAGGFTGWLNPDYDHRLTFTKSGFTTQQVTVRPSSSTYTIVMGTGDSAAVYNSSLDGLSWTVYPDLGKILLPNTTQLFLFNITANLSNIVSCKMEIVNNNSVSLGTTIGCNSQGGNLSLSIPLGMNRSFRGIYSVNIGEGYFIIDADSFWTSMTLNIPERGTLTAFFKYARDLNEWGSDDARQEYSRIVLFFLILSIVMAFISLTTGWDLITAGGSIVFMFFVILFGSYAGFLTISYAGLNPWMDQYVVAFIMGLFTIGFIFNKLERRA